MIKTDTRSSLVVFFIRRFNDVDHITPIAYKMSQVTNYRIVLLSNNQVLDIKNDLRLRFLNEECGVEIDYSYRFFARTYLQRLTASIVCNRGGLKKVSTVKNFLNRTIGRLIAHYISDDILKRIFNAYSLEKSLRECNVSVAVFDWAKPEQHITGNLLNAAQSIGIPTISVPHGINMVVNELWTNRHKEEGVTVNYKKNWGSYDDVVVQFEAYKDFIVKTGFEESKISVLGSTRYCPEWRTVYKKLLQGNEVSAFQSEDKLKIVFMEYPYNYRIHREKALESILNISRLDYVELIVKPHTRSNRLYADVLLEAGSIAYDTPSMILCDEADIVIGTTSSIILDSLLNGKVFIYPKYFHENTMIFEQLGACWIVNSYDELERAVKSVWINRNFMPYDKKNIDALVTEVILGGQKDRDVLSDYVDFIVERIPK